MLASAPSNQIPFHGVPAAGVAGIFVAAVAAWVALHLLKARTRGLRLRALLAVARVAVGFVTLLAAAQLAGRVLLLTTNWRIWPIALGGAVAVEGLLGLYGLERRTVSRRAGLTLASLRVAIVLAVITMLTQPVLSWELVHEIQRYVAILLDESASMQVPDPQRTAAEKLRLAEMLSIRAARRSVRLEQVAKDLGALRQELVAVGEDLALLAGGDLAARQKQLEGRRGDLWRSFTDGREAAEKHVQTLARALDGMVKLDDGLRNALRDAKAQLAVGVRDRLGKAARLVDSDNETRLGAGYEQLLKLLREATVALAKLAEGLEPLGEQFDQRVFASLSDEQRREIAAATDRTRLALARDVLLSRRAADADEGAAAPSLLERLEEGYKLRLYRFAGTCVEGDVARLRRASPSASSAPASAPASRPARPGGGLDEQRTDLAGAIEKAMTEMSDKQLAGIVLLVDGRHNAPRRVEPLAAQLGMQKVPLCSVVMAPQRPPRDAAVVHVRAPQTVVEKDKFLVDAELKLDGLAGQSVEVALYDAKRKVASKTVRVPAKAQSYRPRVQFSDEPKGAGLHAYALRIKAADGEVFADNNEYPLTVSVTKERVCLLVLEDRPRWEFRYIKNIFADRDRNVKLQYVLANPDRIEGQHQRLKVHASASRRVGQIEATLLPASEQEWMKFDVIVLGDTAPGWLGAEKVETIRRFVTRRGGTLIVVAGPNHMPHAYADTPLEEVLPVTFEPSASPVGGALKVGYRIALTAAGQGHPVLFQNVDPEENLRIWRSVPEIYWRHPSVRAKEGTTVLAYAEPPSPPAFLRPPPPEEAGDEAAARTRDDQRRRFELANALIAVHNVAAGRVMALAFDRSWRLRYRVGDTYHHRFWGQVMRWATASKLRAGTDFVKLGTDRIRYAPAEPVRVRAKIVQPDLAPVVSQSVAVRLFRGDRPVLRKRLEYRPDSPGMYEAKIEPLDSGTYRVELEAPEAEPILAADKVKKVVTEFSVDPVSSAEELELSADRGLLRRLASLSGGVVLEPHQADAVLAALGPKGLVRRQRRELRLWDSWPLLVLIVLLATVEWVMRKRVGLA